VSERSCSNCEAAIPPQAQFCTRCGTPSPLESPEPAPVAPPLGDAGPVPSPADDDDVNATRSFAVGGRSAPPPPPSDPGGSTVPSPPRVADLPPAMPERPAEPPTRAMPATPPEPPTSAMPPTQAMPSTQATPGWSPPSYQAPAPQAPQAWQGGPPAPAPSPAPAPWQPQPSAPPWQGQQPPAGPQQWQAPGQQQWPGAGQAGSASPSSRPNNLPAGLLALLGGLLLIAGVFGQWVRTTAETFSGWSASPDAKVVLALGIAALVVGGLLLAGVRHVALRFVLIALGVAALVYAVVDMLSVGNDVAESLNPAIGWGLFLLPVGGVILVVAGLLARHTRAAPAPQYAYA